MVRHSQLDYLRERIATEDRLAEHGETLEARRHHAELAIYYRAEMRALKARQMEIFAGARKSGGTGEGGSS